MAGILTGLAIVLQVLPGLLSTQAVLLTVLSALPIFIITRIQPILGPLAYWLAGLLLFVVAPQQSVFFILVNGPLGVLLGIGPLYSGDNRLISLITGMVVAINVGIILFGFQVQIFGAWLMGPLALQMAILALISFLFCYAYLRLANLVLKQPFLEHQINVG